MPHGIVQYCFFADDAAGTGEVHLGKVTGGRRLKAENLQRRAGIGADVTYEGGIVMPELPFTVQPTLANIFTYLLRAAVGAFPTSIFVIAGDGGDHDIYPSMYMDTWELTVGSEEAAELDCVMKAAVIVTHNASADTPPAKTGKTLEWSYGDVTLGGSNYKATSARIAVNNNITLHGSCDDASDDEERYADVAIIGHEQIEAEIEFLTDPGVASWGDEVGTATIVVVIGNGTITKTFTLTGAKISEFEKVFEADDAITWRVAVTADDSSGALAIT